MGSERIAVLKDASEGTVKSLLSRVDTWASFTDDVVSAATQRITSAISHEGSSMVEAIGTFVDETTTKVLESDGLDLSSAKADAIDAFKERCEALSEASWKTLTYKGWHKILTKRLSPLTDKNMKTLSEGVLTNFKTEDIKEVIERKGIEKLDQTQLTSLVANELKKLDEATVKEIPVKVVGMMADEQVEALQDKLSDEQSKANNLSSTRKTTLQTVAGGIFVLLTFQLHLW